MEVAAAVEAAAVAEAAAEAERERGDEGAALDPVVEVCALFDGLSGLRARSNTLDGSLSLRATQGCVPLLEGNALGRQLLLGAASTDPATPIEPVLSLRRALGGLALDARPSAAFARAHRAVLPLLASSGVLEERHRGFFARFAKGPIVASRSRVELFTGLLVRVARGAVLRVSSTANRRPRGFTVTTRWITHDDGLTPLVLELALAPGAAGDAVHARGEVATLAVFADEAPIETRPLEENLALARAHAAFFSPAYFQEKRDGVTRDYRRLIDAQRRPRAAPGAQADEEPSRTSVLVDAGPGAYTVAREAGAPARACVANLLDFTARFDGHVVDLGYDAARLERLARALEARWSKALGADFVQTHRRALWYLTKYFTLHTVGEPHFFVKGWCFLRTPPGWSTVYEGVHGEGYDVLRGVVHTDVFHAMPAVFALHGPGPITLREGAPLVEATPVPRALLERPWRDLSLEQLRKSRENAPVQIR